VDLAAEAIRLGRQLTLATTEPEARGLLALMLLNHARLPARLDRAGRIVTLDRQDRSLWDTREIAEGVGVLQAALAEAPSIPQISKNLGDICYRLGRFDDAWDAYQRAVRLHPNLGDDLHFKLGNLALKRSDPEAARGYWGKAVELNPRHQLARANLQTLGTNG